MHGSWAITDRGNESEFMKKSYRWSALSVAAALCAFSAAPAHAYLGPGGAVSGIGALLALIGAIIVAMVGFVWFPVKRMLAKKRQRETPESVSADPATVDKTASFKANTPSSTREASQKRSA